MRLKKPRSSSSKLALKSKSSNFLFVAFRRIQSAGESLARASYALMNVGEGEGCYLCSCRLTKEFSRKSYRTSINPFDTVSTLYAAHLHTKFYAGNRSGAWPFARSRALSAFFPHDPNALSCRRTSGQAIPERTSGLRAKARTTPGALDVSAHTGRREQAA